jgi:hypothetical protein
MLAFLQNAQRDATAFRLARLQHRYHVRDRHRAAFGVLQAWAGLQFQDQVDQRLRSSVRDVDLIRNHFADLSLCDLVRGLEAEADRRGDDSRRDH